MLQGFGQTLTTLNPALNWLGYGAKPYRDAAAAPGTYYVPSKHPYQATLPDGIKVQEAYPGQYYTVGMQGLGAFQKLNYPRWMCALAGAAAGAASGYGGGYYYGKKKRMVGDKMKTYPIKVAVGSAIAGAVAGYFMCGPPPQAPEQQPVPPTTGPQPTFVPFVARPDIR